MSQIPSVAELVEQFRLKDRARERGRSENPPSGSPRLDAPETEVIDHCEGLFTERLTDYNKHRVVLEERMRPQPLAAGGDARVEKACIGMKEQVELERAEVEGLTRQAQQSIGDLFQFKKEEGLNNRDAQYPESRRLGWVLLVIVMAFETLVNGVLFAANVSGGMVTGWTYAGAISLVNVLLLGWSAAAFFRMTNHRDPMRQAVGWVMLVVIALVAVALNLFVGHYREALSPDYPPAPETATALPTSDSGELGIAACWVGPDEAAANREAVCLLRHSPFQLGGFIPYLLLMLGVGAWLFGAYEFYTFDDAYPGYGKRDRHRRKAEQVLTDERAELIEKLQRTHDAAQEDLARDFVDPVDSRKLALSAFDKLKQNHRAIRNFRKSLEGSVRGALDIYRTSNSEFRTTPEPAVWKSPWEADWELPKRPDQSGVINREEALASSRIEWAALEDRQARLRSCLEEQQRIVSEFTRLDHFDRAGPQ